MNIRIQMKGRGIVEPKKEEAVSYNAGAKPNPMEDIAANVDTDTIADQGEAAMAARDVAEELKEMKVVDVSTTPIEKLLPESKKPGFDDTVIQDAKTDHAIEGGITKPKTTGPMKFNGDPATEGGMIRKEPLADATPGKYELSGFYIEVPSPSGAGMTSEQVNRDFRDIEMAKLSINGQMYLKPVKEGGFVPCRIIRGGPIICFNEREVLEYIDEKWRRP